MIQLVITLKTIPEKQSVKPQRIAIPHSLHPRESTEVCIFVKDPQSDIKKLFEEKGVKVSKVVGLAKLKANYKEFEAKRKLCGSYDLFLADARITPMLPKLLGKTFFKKKRQPVPVNLSTSNIAEEIQRACDSTYLFNGGGACTVVKIGKTTFTPSDLVENIVQGMSAIVEKIPKKVEKHTISVHQNYKLCCSSNL